MERGLKAVAVTAGYMNAGPRAEFYRHMDAANVDLEGVQRRLLSPGLRRSARSPCSTRCEYLKHETDVWLEITNLMIPGLNDAPEETDAMTRWIVEHLGADVPVHFTGFHPDWKVLDRPATPAATLARAREIALANGIRYAYTGNVHDTAGQSTHCHAVRRGVDRARRVRARRLASGRGRAMRGRAQGSATDQVGPRPARATDALDPELYVVGASDLEPGIYHYRPDPHALGLGAVVVGAFDDREVKRVAGLPPSEEPLALLPVGRPA